MKNRLEIFKCEVEYIDIINILFSEVIRENCYAIRYIVYIHICV